MICNFLRFCSSFLFVLIHPHIYIRRMCIRGRFTAGLAAVLLLWPTVSEHLNMTNNVHSDLKTKCPTAKTGLLGGGAFVALDASLFWLVALMLASNARQDFFEEVESDPKGEFGLVNSAGGVTTAAY